MSSVREWLDKRFPIFEVIERHLTRHMVPRNLNINWNFGSLLLFFFVVQIISGIFLAMYYKPDTATAFGSVQHIERNVNFGWLIRNLHIVGASGFFLTAFLHIGRGIYYGSYQSPRELVWWLGVILMMALMLQAFTGYILPWGQLSYWASTVSTSVFSAIPFVGDSLVIWLRGDFGVGNPTLGRFFSLHTTIIPIGIIGVFIILHLSALHRAGSGNPDGVDPPESEMIPFHPYYTWKDLVFILLVAAFYFFFVFFQPDFFSDPVNNEQADPFKTPVEIVPEWYFLPLYAILRAIPNKLIGLIASNGAIVILFFLPYLDRSPIRSARYRPLKKIVTWLFFINFILLGYAGSFPPEGLPLTLSRIFTVIYFLYFAALPFLPGLEKRWGLIRPLPGEG